MCRENFRTKTRYDTEAKGNSEMVYSNSVMAFAFDEWNTDGVAESRFEMFGSRYIN